VRLSIDERRNESNVTMDLPPEIDLLEILSAEEVPLHATVRLFTSINRARRVVAIYVGSGTVKLLRRTQGRDEGVQDWELRQLLQDPAVWDCSPGQSPQFWLALTDKGREQFINDSRSFYDRLFSGKDRP